MNTARDTKATVGGKQYVIPAGTKIRAIQTTQNADGEFLTSFEAVDSSGRWFACVSTETVTAR